jgi:hypothetical protein
MVAGLTRRERPPGRALSPPRGMARTAPSRGGPAAPAGRERPAPPAADSGTTARGRPGRTVHAAACPTGEARHHPATIGTRSKGCRCTAQRHATRPIPPANAASTRPKRGGSLHQRRQTRNPLHRRGLRPGAMSGPDAAGPMAGGGSGSEGGQMPPGPPPIV